ncbi:MAG TPA: hypothetical protein VHD36_09275 [Pirellulales bacterium]|nr:hypothetical protein [Pirellulales bacterium]
MNGVIPFDPIHHLVVRIMGELGESITDESQITKSVLVREGHYCGRAFRCGDIRAVWFADANELKFYRDRGPLLRAVRLDGQMASCRAAA